MLLFCPVQVAAASSGCKCGHCKQNSPSTPQQSQEMTSFAFQPIRAWFGMEERGVRHQVCCKCFLVKLWTGLGRTSVLVRAIRFAGNDENQTTRGEDCCSLQKLSSYTRHFPSVGPASRGDDYVTGCLCACPVKYTVSYSKMKLCARSLNRMSVNISLAIGKN